MDFVLNCLTTQHHWPFVLMAAAVCVVGLWTALALLATARSASPRGRWPYAIAAAGVSGLAIWTAHFGAMLGYRMPGAVTYAVAETVLSLAVILCGAGLAVALTIDNGHRRRRVAAACGLACAVAAMHFVGVFAIQVQGARIVLDPAVVGTAVAVGLAFAVLAALPLQTSRWPRLAAVSGLLTASVVSLHFGAMSAMTLAPAPAAPALGGISTDTLMMLLAAGVIVIVVVAAFVTGVTYWSRTNALGQMREAIDAMPDGLGFYDAQDRLLVWNARYAEVNPEVAPVLKVGLTFTEMVRIGLSNGVYKEAEGREEAWLAERLALRRGLSSSMEQQISGDRWLRVQDRRTAAGGVVTVCNDISDLKRNGFALAEARDAAEAANRAKSEFLANMSHEIRTPLNGVLGLAQALERTALSADQREILDLIQSSGRTLQTLLSDILDLARVESGRLEMAREPFDLARAVTEAGQLYAPAAREKGLQFFIEIDPEAVVWAEGDAVRLKQILTNLVSNAVKFTSQGFVSLTVARSLRDGVPILRFTVEDTGVGFDAEARDRLFARFEQADGTITRRFGGTGLGLAICRQLLEMMGGALDCESEPGGGSAFIVTLPLKLAEAPAPAAEPAEAAHEAAAGQTRRIRVLVADDHPTNRRVVELILAETGVDLTCVEDGAQAVTAYRASAFDLVLMDMQMPVMDGLTATREIRLHEAALGLPPIPVVMLTANALPDHVAAGRAAGADRHLAKPFNAAELVQLIVELGGQRQALAA